VPGFQAPPEFQMPNTQQAQYDPMHQWGYQATQGMPQTDPWSNIDYFYQNAFGNIGGALQGGLGGNPYGFQPIVPGQTQANFSPQQPFNFGSTPNAGTDPFGSGSFPPPASTTSGTGVPFTGGGQDRAPVGTGEGMPWDPASGGTASPFGSTSDALGAGTTPAPSSPSAAGQPTDFTNWLTSTAPAPYTPPQFSGYGDFAQWMNMDPFQQAGLMSNAMLNGYSQPQYQQNLRYLWGTRDNQTQAPNMTRMSMQNYASDPLKQMGFNNVLGVFGQTPQQYATQQAPGWSQDQGAQVGGVIGG
jgi:hypothetical protein